MATGYSAIRKEVLKTIKPSRQEQERCTQAITRFLKELNSALLQAKAILGGSSAKETWLAGNHDIDIYVLFDYSKFAPKTTELSEYLKAALQKAFPKHPITRLHGSRDYFQLVYEHLHFEVVPILRITNAEQALNITDVSPLHAQWVNVQAKDLKEDILLAKQFCKANRCYGAESYIGGFSGYVLEILVTYYGSFEKMLKASQNWKLKEVIDVAKHYPKKNALFELNQSKLQSPLIVIDPVDKNRNAAAALNPEKWNLFKQKAAAYVVAPNPSYFVLRVMDQASLVQEAARLQGTPILLEVSVPEGKEDVVGVKLVKAFEYIRERLRAFMVLDAGVEWDKHSQALFYFIVSKKELPNMTIHAGPPLTMKDHVAEFKKKYSSTYEEKGKVMAKVKMEHPLLSNFVAAAIREKLVTERVGKVKVFRV